MMCMSGQSYRACSRFRQNVSCSFAIDLDSSLAFLACLGAKEEEFGAL